jgi:hypothetical protein
MAVFTITGSRRLGLEDCEFDVVVESGALVVRELFPIEERGSLCEFVILSIKARGDSVTLYCKPWLPESGAFVGMRAETRRLKAVDRKRYRSVLGDD